MGTESTYSVGHKEGPLAYLRFRTAERSCGFFRHRIGSASRILNCGCGPGSITIGLAQWAPDGQTVGIDLGAEQFDGSYARARDLGVKNVSLSAYSRLNTALPLVEEVRRRIPRIDQSRHCKSPLSRPA